MRISIIGYGYWGPNLVRNFNNTKGVEVASVFDLSEKQLNRVQSSYPSIATTTNFNDVLKDDSIDAVAIATPVFTHFSLASEALKHGKHVLIEKPMTASTEEAVRLIDLAEQNGKILMVDHTYLYTNAVQKIKELIEKDVIGDIKYIDSTRINLGLFQRDVNVLWDLAPHDISICSYLMKDKPLAIQAVGTSHTNNGIENIAYLTLFYPDNRIAHFNCSWVSPVKIRQMLIGGDKKMILFNDLENTEKVRIYDKGYSFIPEEKREQFLVDYRTGDILIPKIEQGEALASMARDFLSAVEKGTTPTSNYQSGLEVVSILEAASTSIKNAGRKVQIDHQLAAQF